MLTVVYEGRSRPHRSVVDARALENRLTQASLALDQRRQALSSSRQQTKRAFAELRRLVTELGTVRRRRTDVFLLPARGRAGYRRPPGEAATGGVERLHQAFARTGDATLRDRLFRHYDDFAVHLARRFPSQRESTEDLVQVARIGLLHAIDRFDPARERAFKGFAEATITGELKRHIRDRTWVMRVPRALQEHYLAVMRAVDDLTQERGRSPRVTEVAERCGLTDDQVLEAMELQASHRPASLDVPAADGEPRTVQLAATAGGFEAIEHRSEVASLVASLADRDRHILRLRFVENLTQAEIAECIGKSQMYVSRRLARTLDRMRARAGAG